MPQTYAFLFQEILIAFLKKLALDSQKRHRNTILESKKTKKLKWMLQKLLNF